MTAATSRLRRRGIGAGVAALVGLTGLGFAAVPAQAAPGFDPSAASAQVAGVDRFDTAARIATATFTSATTVVIANGDRVIDAQAAGYVAGQQSGGAPILLTKTDEVPQFTLDAIEDLGATRAIVIGDEVSVSDEARAQLEDAGLTLTSISGDNRFDTAADIYNTSTTKAKTVFLARGDYLTGQVSPDALAAGPIAYRGTPILLTNSTSLPAETKAAITSGGVTKVVVLGNSINDAVKTELRAIPGVTVETIAGGDRSETAALLADSSYGSFYNRTSAAIANGEKVDALSAGPWAATKGTPILLTLGTNAIGAGTTGYLEKYKSTLTSATVFGDSNSVPASFTAAAKTAAGGDVTSLQTLAVSPSAAASLETTATIESPDVATDNRSYTVTGLTDATQYRVTLVDAANVNPATGVFAIDRTAVGVTSTNPDGANGQQVSGNYLALAGTVTARFRSVNGAAPVNNTGAGLTTSSATGATAVANPVNGSLTFTIDGDAPESLVPVVYINGGAGLANSAGGVSPRLELNASGVPVENFGLGGATTYTALEADAGTNGGGSLPITSVNKTANSFNATVSSVARRFDFDSNDNFQIAGAPSTFAAFSAALSAGDSVAVNYGPDPASVSTFDLTDSNPALSSVTAVAGSGNSSNDITVTANFLAGSLDTVAVERATVTGGTVGAYTTVATITPTAAQLAAGSATWVDNDLAAGTYRYKLTPVNDGDSGLAVENTSNAVAVTPAADTTAPLAIDTIQSTSAGLTGDLDAGDVVKIVFNEPMAAVAAGDTLRLSDGNSTVADVVNGTNATFVLNSAAETVNRVSRAAGTVLTVTITAAPTVVTAGTTAGLQLPVTITDQAGTTDLAGNNWRPSAASQDTVIERAGTDLANNSFDTTSDSPVVTTGTASPVSSPTITVGGTAEPGASVTITRGAYTATVTADAVTGVFSFSGVTLNPNASNSISVVASDTVGNPPSTATTFTVVHDNIAPSAPSGLASSSGTRTSSTTTTISGTAEAGSTVTLTRSAGGAPLTATATGGGTFSFAGVALPVNSTTTFTATARDAAGNVSSSSTALNVAQDSVAPLLVSAVASGSGPYLVTLTYDEDLDVFNGYPNAAAFTISDASSAPLTASNFVFPTTTTLQFEVSGDPTGGEISYSPSGNPIQDVVGNDAASFGPRSL